MIGFPCNRVRVRESNPYRRTQGILRSEVYFVFSRSERIPLRVETCETFLIATTVFVHLVLCYSHPQWSSKDTSSKLLPTKIISYHINDVFNKNRHQPNNPVYSSWDYPAFLPRLANKPSRETPETRCVQILLLFKINRLKLVYWKLERQCTSLGSSRLWITRSNILIYNFLIN